MWNDLSNLLIQFIIFLRGSQSFSSSSSFIRAVLCCAVFYASSVLHGEKKGMRERCTDEVREGANENNANGNRRKNNAKHNKNDHSSPHLLKRHRLFAPSIFCISFTLYMIYMSPFVYKNPQFNLNSPLWIIGHADPRTIACRQHDPDVMCIKLNK